jgi:hypothetical protein
MVVQNLRFPIYGSQVTQVNSRQARPRSQQRVCAHDAFAQGGQLPRESTCAELHACRRRRDRKQGPTTYDMPSGAHTGSPITSSVMGHMNASGGTRSMTTAPCVHRRFRSCRGCRSLPATARGHRYQKSRAIKACKAKNCARAHPHACHLALMNTRDRTRAPELFYPCSILTGRLILIRNALPDVHVLDVPHAHPTRQARCMWGCMCMQCRFC